MNRINRLVCVDAGARDQYNFSIYPAFTEVKNYQEILNYGPQETG